MGRRSRFRPGSSDNEVRSFPQGGIHSKNPVSVKGRLKTELARCHKVGPTARKCRPTRPKCKEMKPRKPKRKEMKSHKAKMQGNEGPHGQNTRKSSSKRPKWTEIKAQKAKMKRMTRPKRPK